MTQTTISSHAQFLLKQCENILEPPQCAVSVLLPTRGRKEALKTSLMSLIDLADNKSDIEILIGMDNDDRETIQWAQDNIYPEIMDIGMRVARIEFERLGYLRLNQYVNTLASHAKGRWLMFWNDDAVMQTQGWDQRITDHDGHFRCLRVKTHNLHPYAIFPIVPHDWYNLFGHLCPHQISDAWISQIAYKLNIMNTIEVDVLHDRHDLTGNNGDEIYHNRPMLEGNPKDPRDFHHPNWHDTRWKEAARIAWFLEQRGEDMSWFRDVINGRQDPWSRMLSEEFDPNRQVDKLRK